MSEDLVHRLRSIAQAYPEDIFGPVTEAETKDHANLITRNSAAMGRHLGQFLTEAADEIERLERGISDSTLRWIPVSERLPAMGQLIAIKYGADSDVYDAYRFGSGPAASKVDFVEWMPLPEPPK